MLPLCSYYGEMFVRKSTSGRIQRDNEKFAYKVCMESKINRSHSYCVFCRCWASDSIPWLRLNATPLSEHGLFANVS